MISFTFFVLSVIIPLSSQFFNSQLIKKNVKHVLTHRILLADFYLWESEERPPLPPDYFWIEEAELDRYAKPRLIERLLESLT